MDDLRDLSLKIKGHKCFGEKEQGFDRILPINVIIGRNNSGKSALLDLVHYAVKEGLPENEPSFAVVFSMPCDKGDLSYAFNQFYPNAKGAVEDWGNLSGVRVIWKKTQAMPGRGFAGFEPQEVSEKIACRGGETLVQMKKDLLSGTRFKRLLSDRDIVPELHSDEPLVQPNGAGATNCIRHFVQTAGLPSDLVEETLLEDLNKIFKPDACFSRIRVLQMDNKKWEVFLDESGKEDPIRLSDSGSGLKTVLLVLVFLHLVPEVEKTPVAEYFFAFEELENNAHPALQRRLFFYLGDFIREHKCHLFLSTHSSTAIDIFGREEDAQIIHVTHDGRQAEARTITTYTHKTAILDDLDIRASDLLQSNGVVWVEGPSDRLYFNRWIDLWTGGELKEGIHYQCVFYAGRLLAHHSGSDPEAGAADEVSIFRINRNAIILMDRDRESEGEDINRTKKRVRDEIGKNSGSLVWVSKGREVENYIPKNALERV